MRMTNHMIPKVYRVAAFGFPLEVSPQLGDIIKCVLTLFQ